LKVEDFFCRATVVSAIAVVFCRLRWHPLFDFGLLALPLCGAAPTFLCSGKEK
jgi:hypothetical protein